MYTFKNIKGNSSWYKELQSPFKKKLEVFIISWKEYTRHSFYPR